MYICCYQNQMEGFPYRFELVRYTDVHITEIHSELLKLELIYWPDRNLTLIYG